jgi:hypothetical protein
MLQNVKDVQSIFDALKEKGIAKVKVCFSGGGDSGQLDDVKLLDATGKNIVTKFTKRWDFKSKTWLPASESFPEMSYAATNFKGDMVPQSTSDIVEALEDVGYDLMEWCGVDYYNNDGGYGEIEIEVETLKFNMFVCELIYEYDEYGDEVEDPSDDRVFDASGHLLGEEAKNEPVVSQ